MRVERLESRDLLTAFTPAQIRHAYGLDNITTGDGTGQTIAIVDAYHNPYLQTDLNAFNSRYGLPAITVDVRDQWGGTTTPAYNSGWAQEIALDVEWAHAIAPGANIMLLEANSSSFSDLLTAVRTATNLGASAVSMSWGSSEFGGESTYDGNFAGSSTVYIASSGDKGAVTSYPAVSPNVLGVGGTTLTTLDSLGTYGSEKGWSSSGGGISKYESKPSFQSAVTQSNSKRTSPDVAYDGDPNSGVYVIFNGSTYVFGGTSAGAPQWAGLVAVTDDLRNDVGLPDLSGGQLLQSLYGYGSPASVFHDVTTGSARNGRTIISATTGYDLLTGLGTPKADALVPALASISFTATVNTQTVNGSGGGSGSPAINSGLNKGCDPDVGRASHFASPTAIVMELVDAADAPAALPVSLTTATPLPEILFASSDADLVSGFRSTSSSPFQPLATLMPRTVPYEASAVTALFSRQSKDAFGSRLTEDGDELTLSQDDSPLEHELVDLALVAASEWAV